VSVGTAKTLHHRETARFRRVASLLARRVRQLRGVREWTIEMAAERFDVEPAHVRRIESGKANPSLAVLVSVAAALGLTVSELLAPRIAKRDGR
jgi:transcriptional regulator with XRE-family HTH domain